MAALVTADRPVGAAMNAAIRSIMTHVSHGTPAYAEVIEWLYREAALLDRGEFAAWLALMASDISYEMPTRSAVLPKEGSGFQPECGLFFDNHASLSARVRRLQTDQAWAEQPRSRTRHFISNVLVDRDSEGTYHVTSSILVTRIRSNRPVDSISGERRDVLRNEDGTLKLTSRQILLDHTVLESHNLSVFF
jgi:3-phenylpropionate/cinnamic acid dioxygenase small subunit